MQRPSGEVAEKMFVEKKTKGKPLQAKIQLLKKSCGLQD